jgi:hypothetical protein
VLIHVAGLFGISIQQENTMTQDGMKRMRKSTNARLGGVLLIGLAAVGGCGSGQAPTLGETAQALTSSTDMKYPWKSGTTQTCTRDSY